MNTNETTMITDAICRAIEQNGGNWNPVYADVINKDGDKVGHIVSDGYHQDIRFDFYPINELRKAGRLNYRKRAEQEKTGKRYHRVNRNKPLNSVIPKWVGKYTIVNVNTYKERC